MIYYVRIQFLREEHNISNIFSTLYNKYSIYEYNFSVSENLNRYLILYYT